jgi:hypothetical protein
MCCIMMINHDTHADAPQQQQLRFDPLIEGMHGMCIWHTPPQRICKTSSCMMQHRLHCSSRQVKIGELR